MPKAVYIVKPISKHENEHKDCPYRYPDGPHRSEDINHYIEDIVEIFSTLKKAQKWIGKRTNCFYIQKLSVDSKTPTNSWMPNDGDLDYKKLAKFKELSFANNIWIDRKTNLQIDEMEYFIPWSNDDK